MLKDRSAGRGEGLVSKKRMIESGNPEIDVSEVIRCAQMEIARVRPSRASEVADERVLSLRASVNLDAIHSWVAIADQRSRLRTKWPSHLRFPLSSNSILRRAIFKVLALLFKDQRQVNEAFIAALRESITLNRQLLEQLELLRERISARERR
jgi:hypothetical protein